MPYPTPTRYLRDEAGPEVRQPGGEEPPAHDRVRSTPCATIRGTRGSTRSSRPSWRPTSTSTGRTIGRRLFRLDRTGGRRRRAGELPRGQFAYVALGHIHKPQALGRPRARPLLRQHRADGPRRGGRQQGVVVFELGPDGLVGEPRMLPLPSTPIYEIDVYDPATDLPRAAGQSTRTPRDDLVNLHITLHRRDGQPGGGAARTGGDLPALVRPRLEGDRRPRPVPDAAASRSRAKSFDETVRDYLRPGTDEPLGRRAGGSGGAAGGAVSQAD